MLSRLRPTDVKFETHRDWRWFVGGAGKVLIALGALMFGFVGYQLWGTGIETELAQRRLEDDFDEMLAAAATEPRSAPTLADEFDRVQSSTSASGDRAASPPPVTIDASVVSGGDVDDSETAGSNVATSPIPAVPVTEQRFPELDEGSALAKLEIPAIGVDDIVVAGIGVSDLKKGPGHFPETPLPGQLGNAAIAGHRTTYGAPFFDVDQLVVGDELIVTTLEGRYVYEVSGQKVVDPSAYEVVTTSDPTRASLTLVSCDPKWTARNRIIITAVLDADRSGAIGEPLLNYGKPLNSNAADPPPNRDAVSVSTIDGADQPGEPSPLDVSGESGVTGSLTEVAPAGPVSAARDSEPVDGLADAFGQGWFSDPAANRHVGAWGVLLGGVALAAWWVTRRSGRNLVGAAVGIVPFVVVLYFFYQNVNRLLPPGL